MSDLDPVFNLHRPAIFAHRGGAAETPESTIEAFLHGLRHGANIIEVDINLTQDNEPVVWHGPELDITFNEDGEFMKDQFVSCWLLAALQSQLWVRHPLHKNKPLEQRRMISLRQLVQFVADVKEGKYGQELSQRPIHLNIELKKTSSKGSCSSKPSWTSQDNNDGNAKYPQLQKVLDILAEAPAGVTTVIGTVDHHIISCFRQIQNGAHVTNLSLLEQLAYAGQFETSYVKYIAWLGPLLKFTFRILGWFVQLKFKKKDSLADYAFETPAGIVTSELVQEVHDHGGGIYAFLSPFRILHQPESSKSSVQSEAYRQRIENLIEMGVDGLMTDYPSELEKVLRDLGFPAN